MPAEPTAAITPDIEHYKTVLRELVDLGAGLARLIHDKALARAEAEPEPTIPRDAAEAYERVARTVRRAVRLAEHLHNPPNPRPGVTAIRRRIIRAVEDKIECVEGEHVQDILQSELIERLDGPDIQDEIGWRPVADIIHDLTRDLAIAHMHGAGLSKRRTPNHIAALNAQAAGAALPEPVILELQAFKARQAQRRRTAPLPRPRSS